MKNVKGVLEVENNNMEIKKNVIICKNRWPIYLFFALYAILPEYLAIEFSNSLPLFTASRFLLIIVLSYYMLINKKSTLVRTLKKESLYKYFSIYFLFRIVANITYVFTISASLKSLFVIILQELILLIIISELLTTKKILYKCMEILIYSSAIIFLVGIIQSFTGVNISYYFNTVSRDMLQASTERLGITRAEATLGHPVYFAQYCALVFPLIMYFYENTKSKKYLIILILDIVAVLLSASRGAIIPFFVITIIMFLDKNKASRRKYYVLSAVIVVCIAIASIINPKILNVFKEIIQSILNVFGSNYELSNFGLNEEGTLSRTMQLSAVTSIIQKNCLIFGLGAESMKRGLVYFLSPISGMWYETNTIDIGYLNYFSDEGIVGIIGIVSLLAGLLIKSIKWSNKNEVSNMNNAFKYCFIMYSVLLLSATPVSSIFWLIISLFISYNRLRMDENMQKQ